MGVFLGIILLLPFMALSQIVFALVIFSYVIGIFLFIHFRFKKLEEYITKCLILVQQYSN